MEDQKKPPLKSRTIRAGALQIVLGVSDIAQMPVLTWKAFFASRGFVLIFTGVTAIWLRVITKEPLNVAGISRKTANRDPKDST